MRAVGYYPRLVAQKIHRPLWVISIGEKGDGLEFGCEHHSVLRLEFDDITEHLDGYKLFSFNYAKRIIEWIDALPDECRFVVVHCEAGLSRSAAVAQFMITDMGFELHVDVFSKKDFSLANSHVYGTLRRALYEIRNYEQ